MSYFLILLSFLFVTQTDPDPKGISITATGEVELPADQIQFNINLNAEADSPQTAYNLHQKRENALVDLLKKYNIKEKNIQYQPVSIRKETRSRNSDYDTTYVTRQSVNVTFSDFDVYEKIQIGLIKNGFDDFNGAFKSTRMDEGQNEAVRKAIQEAKSKAKIIADEAGIKLGPVVDVNYNFSQPQPFARESMALKAQADSGSLLKYDQVVQVTATVSVRFVILQQ